MNGLHEMWELPGFLKNNEPQMNADERRFANWVILLHPHPKIGLCALCVLCGEIKICTAKSAKNQRGWNR